MQLLGLIERDGGQRVMMELSWSKMFTARLEGSDIAVTQRWMHERGHIAGIFKHKVVGVDIPKYKEWYFVTERLEWYPCIEALKPAIRSTSCERSRGRC